MTVSELRDELEYYLDEYGDGEVAIVRNDDDRSGYGYGTIYSVRYYDEFYIIADFDGSDRLCVQ